MRYIGHMETLKTAKLSKYVVKEYQVECPHCGGDVANDMNGGTLNFRSDEQCGQTGTCVACLREVRLPKVLRSGEQG